MSHIALANFLEELDRAGELSRVADDVAPDANLTQMAAQSASDEGPALLLGSVRGHDWPLLLNVLATEKRICLALGVASLDEATEQIARLVDISSPAGWLERLKGGACPSALRSIAPREVRAAACQQIVRLGSDVQLDELPMLQRDDDARSRTIFAATMLSAHPDTHTPLAGRFDLHWSDEKTLAVDWAPYDRLASLWAEYRDRDQKMPAAVVIGGDPSFLLAALAPVSADADLCAVAGLLRGKPLDVVNCRGIDVQVPAEAEVILEGFVDFETPSNTEPAAQRGGSPMPLLHVTAVTHRANPIFAANLPGHGVSCGGNSRENCVAARAMHRVFLPLLRMALPELVDFDLPVFGGSRHWAAVAIRKNYAGQGHRAAHAAWGLPPLRFAKVLIVVDAEVDVHDAEAVLAAVCTNVNPATDVFFEDGPADRADPAAAMGDITRRMAFDATRK